MSVCLASAGGVPINTDRQCLSAQQLPHFHLAHINVGKPLVTVRVITLLCLMRRRLGRVGVGLALNVWVS